MGIGFVVHLLLLKVNLPGLCFFPEMFEKNHIFRRSMDIQRMVFNQLNQFNSWLYANLSIRTNVPYIYV